ncbi:PP2C family protein-serine/threonine phosphatase [Mesomycoplasma molare]|uniref:Protein phosphatase 2C domain-containing protein n=1 Tax=Mesomycoplasma molare TaxID=171288 RepID=A0ABY5TZK2_9BACT|nr:protein phosphatase 2C domain-containing protein [Mesomycoplasma molare]UWD34464.1 protein phosphatase 2C domain-containing protein [Mesomycoplasma molare]
MIKKINNVSFFSVSEKGKREENQDNYCILYNDNFFLFLVADGMGGHLGGKKASEITVETFRENFSSLNPAIENNEKIDQWFIKIVNLSKQKMKEWAENNDLSFLDMGTTLSAVIYETKTKNIYSINIGDSRFYIYKNQLKQITKDQNLLNFYMENEGFTLEEASIIPGAKSLISSLGPKKLMEIDFLSSNMNELIDKKENNEVFFLLTTDGVHDFLSKSIIENILFLKNQNIEYKGKLLIQQALENNSSDNLTLILVEIKDE